MLMFYYIIITIIWSGICPHLHLERKVTEESVMFVSIVCYFVKKERYDLHVELCVKGGHQYEFPYKDAAQLNFSNYSNIVPASFVMYCDLEAMITKEVKVNRGKIQNKSCACTHSSRSHYSLQT